MIHKRFKNKDHNPLIKILNKKQYFKEFKKIQINKNKIIIKIAYKVHN